jgi:hypothetical protein
LAGDAPVDIYWRNSRRAGIFSVFRKRGSLEDV